MTDHRRRIEQLLAETRAAGERCAGLRPANWPQATDAERDAYLAAGREYKDLRQRIADGPTDEIARLRQGSGTTEDIEYGLAYLELDLYYFRSGYTRRKVAAQLSQHALTPEQRARARTLVLDCVDGRKHTPIVGIARLAGSVANNELRRALRKRLHSADGAVAWKAVQALLRIRHPGYTPADIAAARTTLLARPWLSPLFASRFLDPEWELELRDIAAQHGPQRAAAKQLLRRIDYAREYRREQRVRAPRPAHQPES